MSLKLTLYLDDAGKLHIDGPIGDKIACWGLLEAARHAIADFKPAAQPLVQGVSVIPDLKPVGRVG